jgi:hypothetical protein
LHLLLQFFQYTKKVKNHYKYGKSMVTFSHWVGGISPKLAAAWLVARFFE